MRQYGTLLLSYLLAGLCSLAGSGCTVGPDYRPPESASPAAWIGPTPPMSITGPRQTDLAQWWISFGDPTLTSLVDRAVASNLSVQQAEARIRQARAARGGVAAGFWPTADAIATGTRRRSVGSSSRGTLGTTQNLFVAGLDAAWELDLFGGTRRSVEAADADMQATVEDYRDLLVSLAAEVALNYIDLRGLQQQVLITQENLKAQEHSAELTRMRFRAGLVGALDVANAEAQAAITAAQIPVLETAAQQTIYNLSVLLALEPSALLTKLSSAASIPASLPEVPMLLPSELLRRRPDVRRAEAQIHAATARIGVATADLFPKLNLAGSSGFQGNKTNDWLKWKNRIWSFGPSLDWKIFDAGRIRSNIEEQQALQDQAVLSYKGTVLGAFQDVENALIAYDKEQQRRKALADAVTANRKAVDLALRLYTQGQTDFINVLDAERSLYTSEDSLVQSTRTLSVDLVALYKALGGGWEIGTEGR
jgi:outer membrane protein, multidrug efflux system